MYLLTLDTGKGKVSRKTHCTVNYITIAQLSRPSKGGFFLPFNFVTFTTVQRQKTQKKKQNHDTITSDITGTGYAGDELRPVAREEFQR
jgi:hypothetical protein